MQTTRLRVRLQGVDPEVERVVDVPARSALPELHLLLQAAMGWVNVHLHAFEAAGVRYGPADVEPPDDEVDESTATLPDLGDRFVYEYDFGDGWTHDVEVLGVGGDEPGCVDGQSGCPLEDCGGPHGFQRLREVLADPQHPEHRDALAWVGGRPPGFDLAATDRHVRQVVGAVPESVRLFLGLLDGGVKLTAAGRLPRTIVRAVQAQRPQWAFGEKPASREDDLPPLAQLRAIMRKVRLIRVQNGVLSPTRAASDDLEVVRRLRGWFETGDVFVDQLVVNALAVVVAHGPIASPDLAARVLELIGHGWTVDGEPVTPWDVRMEFAGVSNALQAFDQIVHEGRGAYTAGPAIPLLPAAVGMVAAWSEHSTQPHYR
ncbi:plasmid pRiA4b ORF-3 family protein [Actinomycetospora sp. CA-084318]|uniref:plasmid pRiA4b ORF-3 family protein n=1 Tax=Actinomycetospora sp. CA-084318 TaxID=3239892 RepID=UPI003D990B94